MGKSEGQGRKRLQVMPLSSLYDGPTPPSCGVRPVLRLQSLPLKGRASVPETVTAHCHMASVGTWLMPLPLHKSAITAESSTGVQVEKCTSEGQARKRLHVIPLSSLYDGPTFPSCGVRPAVSFLRLQSLPLKGRAPMPVPETVTAHRHMASVGSWLMPLPVHKSTIAAESSTGVQMETCTSECQDRKRLHVMPLSGLYGPLFPSCGVQQALSFLR